MKIIFDDEEQKRTFVRHECVRWFNIGVNACLNILKWRWKRMIKLMTSCTDCMHSKMCKYKNNVESDFNKLKKTTYDSGPNEYYDWETMSEHRNVEIRFTCPDYTTKGVTFR